MTAVLIISLATSAGIISVALVKPSVRIGKLTVSLYWVVALIGGAVLLFSGFVSLPDAFAAFTSSSAVNPIKILVLFLSMTVLSIFLDEIGFFKYLAGITLRRAKTSQRRLFVYLYLIVSVLTIFTSNDIIVLTFTPFICAFAKNAKIDPVPYLVGEFVAANTWSIMLIIGNPTNIYLATGAGIDFISYFNVMALPAAAAGITAFAVLYLLFRKRLSAPLEQAEEYTPPQNKPMLIIGLMHLILCIILMTISSYVGWEMWLISLGFALSLFICTLVYNAAVRRLPKELPSSLKRTPWELVPFVLSMFIIVLALENCGFTALAADFLSSGADVWTYGAVSALIANIINNIPMSVLFSGILSAVPSSAGALYATIIGSNIGAFLSPTGALAGIMWLSQLKTHGVKYSFPAFIKNGIIVAVPTLAAALGVLCLVLN